MSREIKFRVWIKPEHWNEIENKGLMTNGLPLDGFDEWWLNLDIPFDENYSLDGKFTVGEQIEIMQFTGLKDKKGNDIYEGDVFRSETEKDYGDERIYSVVTWIKERGAFYLISTDYYKIYMDNDNLENDPVFEWLFEEANLYDFNIDIGLDLCGNIYENPELVSL